CQRSPRTRDRARNYVGATAQIVFNAELTLNRVCCRIPRCGCVTEKGFVCHVTRERGVMAEDGVFRDVAVGADRLEKIPDVRFQLIPRCARVRKSFERRLLAGFRIILLMPLFGVRFAPRVRKTSRVITWLTVLAGLPPVFDFVFG